MNRIGVMCTNCSFFTTYNAPLVDADFDGDIWAGDGGPVRRRTASSGILGLWSASDSKPPIAAGAILVEG